MAKVDKDQKVASVDAAIEVSEAKYEAIVATAVAANQTLYDQLAALETQRQALSLQINALRVQIKDSEGGDVRKAREAKEALARVRTSQGQRGPGRMF